MSVKITCDICQIELSSTEKTGLIILEDEHKLQLNICQECSRKVAKKLDELKGERDPNNW